MKQIIQIVGLSLRVPKLLQFHLNVDQKEFYVHDFGRGCHRVSGL